MSTRKPAAKKPPARKVAAKKAAPKRPALRSKPAAKSTEAAVARVMPAVTTPEMSELEKSFIREYLIDQNGTRAYLRVKPGAATRTACTEASRLLSKPEIVGAVAAGAAAMRRNANLDADEVLRRMGVMAQADERELMEVRVASCRYCHGEGHRYHYTAAEFERAEAEHAARVEQDKASGDFDPKGGVGYNANTAPNPECPECFGDGTPRAVFKDTRYLSEKGASMFAGVKVTRDGFEIKTHSRENALVNLARVHSLFNDSLKLKGKVEVDATEELKQFLRERPSRLPVATGDDE